MCKCKQGGQNNTCNGGTCLNNGCRRQQRSQGVQFNINYIFRPTLKKSWRIIFLSWKQAKALFLFLFLLWMIPPTSWMLHVKHIIYFLIAFSYFYIWPWKFLRKPVILLFFCLLPIVNWRLHCNIFGDITFLAIFPFAQAKIKRIADLKFKGPMQHYCCFHRF